MQLKLVFLFVVLAFVRAEEEECGEEKAGECIGNLLLAALGDESEEEMCKVMRETSRCLDETADECFGDNKDPELEEGLREIRQIIATNCPATGEDVPDEIEQCVEALEEEMMECMGSSIEEALENIVQSGNENPDETEIKCSVYDSVARCITRKVEDKCGREAARLALAELIDADDEIKADCKLPGAKAALKGLMYEMARRRRK